jgi:tetratricopeptide (TPR) repeat protein
MTITIYKTLKLATMRVSSLHLLFIIIWVIISLPSCKEKKKDPSPDLIAGMDLKRGAIISCGPPGKEFGFVDFSFSGGEKIKEDFNLGVKLLHSFEYDEAEKVFARVIDQQPGCAMAYWGVAMSNFHPLWTAPLENELKKGAKAIEIAQELDDKSEREADYIDALATFYNNWEKDDHRTRTVRFEKAMEKLYKDHPEDMEAATFYALSLNASADPTDKTFQNQKKAGRILTALYPGKPDHPGVVHYIIHTYDYPELADQALAAARKYASVAPSSAHALHMPSHIFTRLGLWDECLKSNLEAIASAQCYAQSVGLKGHWDEELHVLDYLIYAYLQKGDNEMAGKQLNYLKTISEVSPFNFKVAYAFAAIPSRYVLENKMWKEAANLQSHKKDIPWNNFVWQDAIVHFTRLMGSAHLGNKTASAAELKNLEQSYESLAEQKDTYKANQVLIQIKAGSGWMHFKEGRKDQGLALMKEAVDLEDKTEKHPVTPCEVVPARQLLADMYMEMGNHTDALNTYMADLQKHPGRFNGVFGAGAAAQQAGMMEKAAAYYNQLATMVHPNSSRKEMIQVKKFLQEHGSGVAKL